MKRFFFFLAFLLTAGSLPAQTNEPVKLAIVAESPDASAVCDILTAQLSANSNVRLLERDEIDKVYHEQGMSAENQDDVKLGRLLGADGLLMLNVEILMKTNPISGIPSQVTNLTTRLIAVKPGVILADENFSTGDFVTWSSEYASHLDPFLPKLTLDPGSAIPISVVNLRSAISSEQESEVEKELKSLTIQRLSQEQRFFVLERERMQEMEREKGFNADESAFWDGSYLLEGTVDQNGYSGDVITVDVRLTPPKGGAPLSFQVSGARTNLTEVINQLADKVAGLLKVQSAVPAWSATDEASRFFAEANWAIKWGEYPEAEAAADSAWALGKQDLECALVRIQAYVCDLSTHIEVIDDEESSLASGKDAQGQPVGPAPTEADILSDITNVLAEHPWGVVHKEAYPAPGVTSVALAFLSSPPAEENIDRAIHALELYYDFSRSSPDGQPKVLWSGPGWEDWHDSDWYKAGIDDLEVASRVLQNFNLSPASQGKSANRLADLRALARSVAALISQSPSVHTGYFVGDRPVTHDELANTIGEQPNIFRCEVTWGCYWQERPEDTLSLYRELMTSPVFSYIQSDFWIRTVQTPRLIAWNEDDQKGIPTLWNHFMEELDGSTNLFLRLENRALLLADVNNEADEATAFTNLLNGILDNSDAFVTNNVEVLYLNWGIDALVEAMMRETVVAEAFSSDHTALSSTVNEGITGPITESLQNSYRSYYEPKLEAMDQEYWSKTVPSLQAASAFDEQKEYLANNTPFDFVKFTTLFQSDDYSKVQAEDILSLIIAYKSNLVSQCLGAIGMQQQVQHYSDAKSQEIMSLIVANRLKLAGPQGSVGMQKELELASGIDQVDFLEDDVKKIINTSNPAVTPAPVVQSQPVVKIAPTPIQKTVPQSMPKPGLVETETNVTVVDQFIPIPVADLFRIQNYETVAYTNVIITAHQVADGKLIFDLHYVGNTDYRNIDGSAVATFDPGTEAWTVMNCPPGDPFNHNNYYHRTALVHGEFYHSDAGKIWKYDNTSGQWQPLNISDGNNYELFAINSHLYAANESVIFEIADDGNTTHILASTRRQPAMSALDSLAWGTPTLFEGPEHSLRVSAADKIFAWTGKDWHPDFDRPSSPYPPEIFPSGVLFRSVEDLSFLGADTNALQLSLWQKYVNPLITESWQNESPATLHDSRWEMPAAIKLYQGSVFIEPDRLFLLFDHSTNQEISNDQQELTQEKIIPKEGYEAELLNFSPDLPLPQNIFLQFVSAYGCPPLAGGEEVSPAFGQRPPFWMAFVTNGLFFGLEIPRNGIPFSGSDRLGIGYTPGIWLMPLPELESAVDAQKKIQLDQMARDRKAQLEQMADQKAAADALRAQVMSKYDLNHNGVIDPDEKEAALADPAFIESELDTIDTNHNGMLDLEELAYFDANNNKVLDTNEQTGIDIALRLLAERLIKKFDENGTGTLNQEEFRSLEASLNVQDKSFPNNFHPLLPPNMRNRADAVNVDDVADLLRQQLMRKFGQLGISRRIMPEIMANPAFHGPGKIRQIMFKAEVEAYWQNPGNTDQSPRPNN